MNTLEFWNTLSNYDYAYTVSSKKRVVETNDDVTKLKTALDDLHKSVKYLKKYTSGVTSKERMKKQLTDFVKSYNNVAKKSEGITDKELKAELDKLENLVGNNEKFLKEIGITKNKKGKYEFDTDQFEDVKTEDIDALFAGRNSFIIQANKILGNIGKEADASECVSVVKNISYTKKYDKVLLENLRGMQTFASDLSDIAKAAGAANEAQSENKDYKSVIEENKNNILGVACDFDELFRRLASFENHYQLDEMDSIKTLLDDEEILNNLEKVGVKKQFDDEHNTIQLSVDFHYLDDPSPEKFDAFCEAFEALFGENNIFANTIINGCRKAFIDIVDPESLGVTIDQYV